MKKWIPNIFYPFEYEELAYYLERQAAKGWILEDMGPWLMRFRKTEPKSLRYCADIPSVRRKRGGSNEYLESYYQMCEEAGWSFVATDRIIHVFATEDPALPPIHTESKVRYEAVMSDLGPRMFGGILALLLLYGMRLSSVANIVYAPPLVSGLTLISVGLVLMMEIGMVYRYLRWKKQQEEACVTGVWQRPLKLWPIQLRLWIHILLWGLLLAMLMPWGTAVASELSGLSALDVAWELVGNPLVMMLVYLLCSSVISRFLWKKGYDDRSGNAIGVLVGAVVLILLLGLIDEMQGCAQRREDGMAGVEKMDAVEQIPLTVEVLGLTASYDPLYHQDKDMDYALGRYTAMLDNGGYLKYDYYRYRDEADAIHHWESIHKRYTWNVEQYTGEGTPYHFEWLEQDLTVLQADQAAVVVDIDKESSYILYHYLIQKGNVYWEINYLSEEPLTEGQLLEISVQLP